MSGRSEPISILLVEDSEDDAFFFRWTLNKTELDCKYEHVMDGSAAIQYLEAARQSGHVPEAIFLDLKMPGMSGFEVLEWIRDQKFEPPLNVLVLSGSDQDGDIRRARTFGVERYLVKPINSQQFVEELDKARQQNSKREATSSSTKV